MCALPLNCYSDQEKATLCILLSEVVETIQYIFCLIKDSLFVTALCKFNSFPQLIDLIMCLYDY